MRGRAISLTGADSLARRWARIGRARTQYPPHTLHPYLPATKPPSVNPHPTPQSPIPPFQVCRPHARPADALLRGPALRGRLGAGAPRAWLRDGGDRHRATRGRRWVGGGNGGGTK